MACEFDHNFIYEVPTYLPQSWFCNKRADKGSERFGRVLLLVYSNENVPFIAPKYYGNGMRLKKFEESYYGGVRIIKMTPIPFWIMN